MQDLKHISKPGNKFTIRSIYYGNYEGSFMSWRDYAYGYYEIGKTAIITFIKHRIT